MIGDSTLQLRVMFQESEKETAKEVKNNNLLQVPKLKRTEQVTK